MTRETDPDGGYRDAFDGAADALFIASGEGRYLAVNERALALTGYSREELLAMSMRDLVDPADLAARPFAFNELREGHTVLGQRLMNRKDGSRFPAEIMGRMLPGGKLLGSVRDISERVRLENELRESEDRYRSLVAACPDGILQLDREGVVTYASPAALKLFGARSDEDLVGRSSFKLLAAGQQAVAVMRLTQRMAGEDLAPTEWDVLTLDGRRLVCELNLGIVRDPQGNPTSIVTLARDVTERRRAEDQLRHVSRLYAVLSHTSQAVVRATDREGFLKQVCAVAVEHGRARMAWVGLLDAATGRIVPVAVAGVHEGYLTSLRTTASDDAHGLGPTGTAVRSGEVNVCDDIAADPRMAPWREQALARGYVSSAAVPFRCGNQLVGALSLYSEERGFFSAAEQDLLRQIANEISFALDALERERERARVDAERRALQEQLVQAQKMESVGRLAGGVAHDFNNMLSVIMGNLDLAMATLDPQSELHATLESAKDAARRSADITRQLLTFARKQTTAPRVLDLSATVEGALKMLRRLMGEDVELSWQPARGLWPVRIDPAQLDQILANLAANARDAIAGVGRVVVRTENLVVRDATVGKPGDYVLLTVSDSGAGMDAETLAHAFEPFFTTKPGEQGTGLGLATVYGIVEQNGGAITIQSAVGSGTTFRIYLPRVHADPSAPETVSRAPLTRGQGTILVVEDEASLGRVVGTVLTRLGYTVISATTPAEAIATFEQQGLDVDLLLTDIVMPEMNGRDLAHLLMARSPRLKCLYMSGYHADVVGHGGVLDEGVQLLQKPFTIEELANRVAAALVTPPAPAPAPART